MPATMFEVGTVKFWALGDRILVQEDEFRTGYECSPCNGSGNTACENCQGTGECNNKKCSHCAGQGHIRCVACNGKGALIVAPEVSERRPTTGTIVSAGPDCKEVKVGDSVLYSNFGGYVVDLNRAGQKVVMRILHETELLAGMEGHLTLTNLKGKSELALPSL